MGQNVKMLMPDNIAAKHDEYLSNYATTHKKTVIDSVRVMQAKKKNGKLFDVEVSVKEIIVEGGKSYFAGFVKPVQK